MQVSLAPATTEPSNIFYCYTQGKGQLISEYIYEVIISPKIRTKIVRISALCREGRNPDNFLFVFWEKQ